MKRDDLRTTLRTAGDASICTALEGIGIQVSTAPLPEVGAQRLGRFLVRRELGKGGMGRVLLAHDPDLRRDVAIKVLHDDVDEELLPSRLASFLLEGRIASRLDHPNIVPVHELGTSREGELFLVMRRIRGISLAEALAALREDPDGAPHGRARLVGAMVQVCQAIGYAHERGVLHRDLKPQNVMLGGHGQVLVVDWGLAASLADGALGERASGAIVGTPGYMSPEVLEGDTGAIGARSDVFSLGAVLYEVLALRPAFTGEPWTTVDHPPDPRGDDPGIDPELSEICLRALAASPGDRFQDASALGEALAAWQEGVSRRRRAQARLARGRTELEAWSERHRHQRDRLAALARDERELSPWLPLAHPEKRALQDRRDAARREEVALARGFAEVLASGEAALALDPGSPAAAALLADAYWERLVDAELRKDERDQAYFRDRVAAHDDGSRLARLGSPALVSLSTEPSGARVHARRYDEHGVVWPLGPPRSLGRTPLVEVPLEPGSWLLIIEAEGFAETRYPVLAERGRHWTGASESLRLRTAEELGSRWIHVPGGPAVTGGDDQVNFARPRAVEHVPDFLIAARPVSAADYAGFIRDLWDHDPAAAWARVPRDRHGAGSAGSQLWPRSDGPDWRFPLVDKDGDAWQADWPVSGISWHDGVAYADWLSERTGLRIHLVEERQFEKAARGVDGRSFPWGDRFDAAACLNLHSRQTTPRPESIGTFGSDRSPYGVQDLGGSMRTWCRASHFDGDPALRPVRGGCWSGGERFARAANRYPKEPDAVHLYLGLRLCISLEDA